VGVEQQEVENVRVKWTQLFGRIGKSRSLVRIVRKFVEEIDEVIK